MNVIAKIQLNTTNNTPPHNELVVLLLTIDQEKVFGNLGFLLHVLIIGASLAF